MTYTYVNYMSASDIAFEEGRPDTIVISIRSPGMNPAKVQAGFRDVMYLEFDNVETLSSRHIRFCLDHAQQILDFVAKHEGAASRILVNCMMGESRSAAVAYHLANKFDIELENYPENPLLWVMHVLRKTEKYAKRAPESAVAADVTSAS